MTPPGQAIDAGIATRGWKGPSMRDPLSGCPALLTYQQVGEQLGISLSKIQTLVKDGGLPAVNVGERSHRVRRTDLAAYVETLTPVPAQVAS